MAAGVAASVRARKPVVPRGGGGRGGGTVLESGGDGSAEWMLAIVCFAGRGYSVSVGVDAPRMQCGARASQCAGRGGGWGTVRAGMLRMMCFGAWLCSVDVACSVGLSAWNVRGRASLLGRAVRLVSRFSRSTCCRLSRSSLAPPSKHAACWDLAVRSVPRTRRTL